MLPHTNRRFSRVSCRLCLCHAYIYVCVTPNFPPQDLGSSCPRRVCSSAPDPWECVSSCGWGVEFCPRWVSNIHRSRLSQHFLLFTSLQNLDFGPATINICTGSSSCYIWIEQHYLPVCVERIFSYFLLNIYLLLLVLYRTEFQIQHVINCLTNWQMNYKTTGL